MARLTKIRIKGFRSVCDDCEVSMPPGVPLVLIGENNAGKSNIVRAIDLMQGEYWPSYREVTDHDYHGRDRNGSIEIEAFFDDLFDRGIPVSSMIWAVQDGIVSYSAFTEDGDPIKYIKKELRQACQSMVVGADRRLSYQLSYTSKSTMLSKLMRRFHDELVRDPDRVDRLKAEFDNLIALFREVDQFQEFETKLGEHMGEMLEGMTHGLSVDFSAYDPSNFFHSLRVLPKEGDATRTFEELGTGQEQILALVFAHAYAKAFYGGILLVIEEPEAHLHPLAQQWLARKIRDMAADGLQIVITTHNPVFIDVMGLAGVALVRKLDGSSTSVKQLTSQELADFCVDNGVSSDDTDSDTILPFYANASTASILAGLFARRVVLVEGPTEEMALPAYMEKVDLDVVKCGIAIIAVHGKGNLAKWWRFFRAYEVPTYVIFDNDNQRDRDARRRSDLLNTVGIPDGEMDAVLALDTFSIKPTYAVFGKNFEVTLRALFPSYAGLEDEIKGELGTDSKPLIAKYVASRVEILADSPVQRKFLRLKNAILEI